MDGVKLLHDLDLGRFVTVQAGASGHPGIMVLKRFGNIMLSSTFQAEFDLTD
jgi:hypothetical protein